jgi:tetratricopeptide (TPR) repeat protein
VNQCVENDPPVYDAFYGLGVYHYWRGAKLDIGLFKDSKKRAIQEIGLAIRKGRFSQILGKLSIVMIYFNEEEYEKAWKLNEELMAFHPASGFLYNRGRIAARLEDWETVEATFQVLLNMLCQTNYPCYGYLMECSYFIAQAHYHLGNLESAVSYLEEGYMYKEQINPDMEVEGIFDSYKEVIEKLEALYEMIY